MNDFTSAIDFLSCLTLFFFPSSIFIIFHDHLRPVLKLLSLQYFFCAFALNRCFVYYDPWLSLRNASKIFVIVFFNWPIYEDFLSILWGNLLDFGFEILIYWRADDQRCEWRGNLLREMADLFWINLNKLLFAIDLPTKNVFVIRSILHILLLYQWNLDKLEFVS